VLRVALSGRVPFRIDEHERSVSVTLYGARADIDWVQYGETDSPVRALSWDQRAQDEVTIAVQLDAAVWGYSARWQGRDLLVAIRRPPVIDIEHPLRGRTVLLDPGHPPGGSTGPSGQREPEVTLAVARLARQLLEERGARVSLTRDADTAVSLTARVNMAQRGGADVLVSIHTNGLPDGINPFENHGTSTYYFHPRSLPLARAVNRAIAAAFGTRDLGVGRGDLALARPTWLPAILVEGLFQMMPEHDGWLATEEGRRRYAQAIVDGLEVFFARRATDP
jgi:N-acetylmuramoyl-L-alanine amidase